MKTVIKIRNMIVLIGILFITVTSCSENNDIKKESKKELSSVLLNISKDMRTLHYKKVDINNNFSEKVLKNYLDLLDYNHQYFTQKEIDQIYKTWGTKLDNDFLDGDVDGAFAIFNMYKAAVIRVTKYQEKLLNKPEDLDFTKNERLLSDREDSPYFNTDKAYYDHWRKMLKYSILSIEDYENLTYKQSVVRMKNRLKTRIKLIDKKTTDDIYSYYVNSFLKEYDPHTTYLSAKAIADFNISMKLQLSGIGAVLTKDKAYIKVVKIIPDGPAAKGQLLQPEDKIIAVAPDGKKFEDIMDWPLGETVNLIRGKKGTKLKLKVIPNGSKSVKIYTFIRDNIKLEDRGARYFIKTVKAKNKSYKIAVIILPSFYMDFDAFNSGDKNYKSTTRDIKKILIKLNKQNVDGLIIDLRNNGGGSLSEVNNLMGLFITTGPVVQVRGEVNGTKKISYLGDTDQSVYFTKPVVVMVNRLSASASEIFAAAMQDYRRGIIVGTTTFGKGTVQTMSKLELGELKYTNGKFYRITGKSTQLRGVTPDIFFPPLYDSSKIGESSLENPLPWDELKSLINQNKNISNAKLKSFLNTKHIARTKSNPDFIFDRQKYAIMKQIENDKQISLNQKTRKKEQTDIENQWLKITNEMRKAKHQKLIKTYKELENINKEKAKKDEIELLKSDSEIIESVKILTDELELYNQQTLNNK